MKASTIAHHLWGDKAKFSYLFMATLLLLFTLLGSREVWTQEHRWADIVAGMFYRHDFLHPFLGNTDYYDKPLLSYWLVAILTQLNQSLTTWTLRLPSALAGVLAIWSIYRLGTQLKNKSLGLLAGWILLTTYYFVFWSRTSSADMLNMAGCLLAVSWYVERRHQANFFDYSIFFIILAVTSLCKGLIGVIIPLIAVFIDIVLQQSWKKHVRLALFMATLPALGLYLLPFMASSYFANGDGGVSQNGLYLVYRENVLRYFQPFDHQMPFYVYFIYLPLYLLPWAVLFVPALFALKSRWKTLSLDSKWIVWVTFALFMFFTLSGSRRSYYVLPIVPFAILLIADWVLSESSPSSSLRKQKWSMGLVVFSFISLYVILDMLPAWYYSRFGVNRFAVALKEEASTIKPWKEWDVIGLDAESKMNFYLNVQPTAMKYHIKGVKRHLLPTEVQLRKAWPLLQDKTGNVIFVSRKMYGPMLKNILVDYQVFEIPYPPLPFFKKGDEKNQPIAFIPKGGDKLG